MTPRPQVWSERWPGALVVWAGWLLPQLLLLGPALVGRTVACPADLLALPGFYLPNTPEYKHVVPRDPALSDLVFVAPAFRDFMAREFRAGRLPLWRPDNFAGVPFAVWPKYSPFEWLYVATAPDDHPGAWRLDVSEARPATVILARCGRELVRSSDWIHDIVARLSRHGASLLVALVVAGGTAGRHATLGVERGGSGRRHCACAPFRTNGRRRARLADHGIVCGLAAGL